MSNQGAGLQHLPRIEYPVRVAPAFSVRIHSIATRSFTIGSRCRLAMPCSVEGKHPFLTQSVHDESN
jgi:hypothetical protein